MENGRRFYGIEQILRLQEILYFKEIGFGLKKIKSLLEVKNLNRCTLLSFQKKILMEEIARLEKVVKSIDKTIEHYKENKMTTQEACKLFGDTHKKIKAYEAVCEQQFGKEYMDNVRKKMENIGQKEQAEIAERSKELTTKLIAAINDKLPEDSAEVQALMVQHFELSTVIQSMSKDTYLASRDLLLKGPSFYEQLHPKLPDFLYRAMTIFAERVL